jgi:23S rRNA (cytidine1920-2'-O)/16S rRNA (cytidine1409-2'-O)-methyltransferase
LKKLKLIDILLANKLAENEQVARALILAGRVYSANRLLDKEKEMLRCDISLFIKNKAHQYVSRAALKLAHGLSYFNIAPNNLIALDIGCGAGGFSQVLLEQNVAKVYAVDVGYGEFSWSLRQDQRVVLLERTNAKYLNASLIVEKIDLLVCDASFIGLAQILPPSLALLKIGGKIVALIKPQFEVAKSTHLAKGIVEDPLLHQEVIAKITAWLESSCIKVIGVCASPIKGTKGNIEFLIAGEKVGDK